MRIKGIDIREVYGVIALSKTGFFDIPDVNKDIVDWGDGDFRVSFSDNRYAIGRPLNVRCLYDSRITSTSFDDFKGFCNESDEVEIQINEGIYNGNPTAYGRFNVYIQGIYDIRSKSGLIEFTLSLYQRSETASLPSFPASFETGAINTINGIKFESYGLICSKVLGRNQLPELVDGVQTNYTLGVGRKSYRDPEKFQYKFYLVGENFHLAYRNLEILKEVLRSSVLLTINIDGQEKSGYLSDSIKVESVGRRAYKFDITLNV